MIALLVVAAVLVYFVYHVATVLALFFISVLFALYLGGIFDAYADSSLNFFIYAFTRTKVWDEYHAVKQDVLFRIGRIIEKHGAEIAFPTRTLHMPQGLMIDKVGEEQGQ